jgi:acetolactate synthase I/II/III large subunit
VKLAEAYGLPGYRVTNQDEFEAAFKAAMEDGRGAVIDCIIDKDAKVHPMVNGGDPATKFLLD